MRGQSVRGHARNKYTTTRTSIAGLAASKGPCTRTGMPQNNVSRPSDNLTSSLEDCTIHDNSLVVSRRIILHGRTLASI